MRLRPHTTGDLAHRDPSDDKGVRDEGAMATPWNGFRAHQDDLRVLRELDTPIQTSSELRGLHVVGIPAETCIPPPAVRRVPPRVAQSAQAWDMRVPHPDSTQRMGEHLAAELRVVPRSWNCADVDDASNPVSGEQTDELVDRSC
jgi:hypothetical protein